MKIKVVCVSLCAFAALFFAEKLHAQVTAFTYQGRLNDGGSPANNIYDLRFQLYDAVTNGNTASVPLTNSAVAVSNGLFVVTLDFGGVPFIGQPRWLDIGVRTNGDTNAFTILYPRQQITPTPYAIFANNASNLLGNLPAAQLSGTLPASAFAGYTNTVALTNGANIFSGAFNGIFSGNGGSVTNVSVTNLTGVLADNQLPANTAFVNSNQTFSGVNNLTNWGNNFVGSFFGNGLVGWIATNATAFQAEIDHGYLLTNSQVVTVTLPSSPNVGDIVRIACAGANGWRIAQNSNQSILGNFFAFGETWIQSGAGAANWTCIASSSDGSKMAATINSGGVYLSMDSGRTWAESGGTGAPTSAALESIAISADGSRLVAAATNNGDIYISSNSGSTWSGSTSGNWTCVASSSDGSKLVATDYGGGIYTNSGTVWTRSYSTGANSWSSVASSSDGGKLVAAFYGGSLYISSNSGKNWTAASGTSGKNWKAVASSSDGSKWVAAINNASSGGIYISTDSGASWTQTSAPAESWVSVASSSDGNRLVAVIYGGGIYTSGNEGATWTQQTGAPTANWSCVASSSDGSKLAATIHNSTSGGIYTSAASSQSITTIGANGYISGGQGSAVELQYIGNNQFMPVSFSGTIWAY